MPAVPAVPPGHSARGAALMVASAACFTANVLLVRLLGEMHAANSWLVCCVRFVVGLLMIGTVYRREFQPGHLIRRRQLIERGVVGGIGVYVTYLTVIQLGAGRATFIGNTYPIWGALLAAWILRERLQSGVLAGGLAAIAGLGLLTSVFSTNTHPGIYDLLAFTGAWLSAYVVVTIRQLHATEHTSTIFAAQCAYGLVICAVPGVLTWTPLPAGAWAVMLAAGVCAGGGQLTMTRAFRDLPVGEGSLLQMLVPLGTAAGGMVFFGERFALREAAGAALIVAGTAFILLRQPDPANAEAE